MSWEQLNPPVARPLREKGGLKPIIVIVCVYLKQIPKEIRWNLEGHWYAIGQKLPCLHFKEPKFNSGYHRDTVRICSVGMFTRLPSSLTPSQVIVSEKTDEQWKKHGCLGYVRDYTNQFYWDSNKPIETNIRIPIIQPVQSWNVGGFFSWLRWTQGRLGCHEERHGSHPGYCALFWSHDGHMTRRKWE